MDRRFDAIAYRIGCSVLSAGKIYLHVDRRIHVVELGYRDRHLHVLRLETRIISADFPSYAILAHLGDRLGNECTRSQRMVAACIHGFHVNFVLGACGRFIDGKVHIDHIIPRPPLTGNHIGHRQSLNRS